MAKAKTAAAAATTQAGSGRKRKEAHRLERSSGGGELELDSNRRRAKRAKKAHHHQDVHPHLQAGVARPRHALLAQYYPSAGIWTLREWALLKLPRSSRIRRKKMASVGLEAAGGPSVTEDELSLGRLLDSTIVCCQAAGGTDEVKKDDRWEKWLSFSQKGDESYVTLSEGFDAAVVSQTEIVHYIIWCMFEREKGAGRPAHLLCDGFRKQPRPRGHHGRGLDPGAASGRGEADISNAFAAFRNDRVRTLKKPPWPQLLMLLGKEGERIMIDLLLDCAIFDRVEAGKDNLYQLSGLPLPDLETLAARQAANAVITSAVPPAGAKGAAVVGPARTGKHPETSPSDISFVRSRMLYARAALSARGLVHFGLRHIHVLNRFPCKPPTLAAIDGDDEGSPFVEPTASTPRRGDDNTVHVMMYIFPRQFGLHNVFTSAVDRKQTTQKFQDYTLREEEIAQLLSRNPNHSKVHVPKRLRSARDLVRKLQLLHARCSYIKLLQHYCPAPEQVEAARSAPASSARANKSSKSRKKAARTSTGASPALSYAALVDLATPVARVSAYCRAVLSKIVPNDFWGQGETMTHNKWTFLRKVDHFVHLQRFENLSLHEAMQGMKTVGVGWLAPPHLAGSSSSSRAKCSATDLAKRRELFAEFLYYLFDSLLMPLVRSNFYVTESSAHRYRLFYFRHDVWRCVAEPAMAALKAAMFEEVRAEDARRVLASRPLGFSQVRLLPKAGTAMRPIMNLGRRTQNSGGKMVLGRSINSVLGLVSEMLKFEKATNPALLGSSMFSVSDMYERIKAFKTTLGIDGSHRRRLYFAKVDVRAAFDTIPQDAILHLMADIPQQTRYKMAKHVEVSLAGGFDGPGSHNSNNNSSNNSNNNVTNSNLKVTRKWTTLAKARDDKATFRDCLRQQAAQQQQPQRSGDRQPAALPVATALAANRKRGVVFVDTAYHKYENTSALLSLLGTHVRENLVRIGKKYYRQRTGISQGSVLSTALCSYFYADLEARHLGFLRHTRTGGGDGDADDDNGDGDGDEDRENDDGGGGDALLMRLLDDFMLITTDRRKAARFVKVMHGGLPRYGVTVSAEKSLVNFELELKGRDGEAVVIPRLAQGRKFPYCGTAIDCETLEVGKMRPEDGRDSGIHNSLTVEFSRHPGQNFKRKTLRAFKLQSHIVYFDTSHNALQTVLANAYGAFVETATKAWAYARRLPRQSRPGPRLMIDTIKSLIDVAFLLLTSKSRKSRNPHYRCEVKKAQIAWLVMVAFRQVLARKQAGHGETIAWLEDETRLLSAQKDLNCQPLVRAAQDAPVATRPPKRSIIA